MTHCFASLSSLAFGVCLLWSSASFAAIATLDTSFGVDGMVRTDLGSPADYAKGVVVDERDRIYVLAVRDSVADGYLWYILRYLPNGVLDTSFGVLGRLALPETVNFSFSGLALSGEGFLLSGDSRLSVFRFGADGLRDRLFGVGGVATAPEFSTASVISTAADGKIVVGGEQQINGLTCFAIARYTAEGVLDPSFAGAGGTPGRTMACAGRQDATRFLGVDVNSIFLLGSTRLSAAGGQTICGSYYWLDGDGKPTTDFGNPGLIFLDIPNLRRDVAVVGRLNAGGNRITSLVESRDESFVITGFSLVQIEPPSYMSLTSDSFSAPSGFVPFRYALQSDGAVVAVGGIDSVTPMMGADVGLVRLQGAPSLSRPAGETTGGTTTGGTTTGGTTTGGTTTGGTTTGGTTTGGTTTGGTTTGGASGASNGGGSGSLLSLLGLGLLAIRKRRLLSLQRTI